jgi:hypothetical protein
MRAHAAFQALQRRDERFGYVATAKRAEAPARIGELSRDGCRKELLGLHAR